MLTHLGDNRNVALYRFKLKESLVFKIVYIFSSIRPTIMVHT